MVGVDLYMITSRREDSLIILGKCLLYAVDGKSIAPHTHVNSGFSAIVGLDLMDNISAFVPILSVRTSTACS
jgi:hypothetical protein